MRMHTYSHGGLPFTRIYYTLSQKEYEVSARMIRDLRKDQRKSDHGTCNDVPYVLRGEDAVSEIVCRVQRVRSRIAP